MSHSSTEKNLVLPGVDFSFYVPTPPTPQQSPSTTPKSDPPLRFSFPIPESIELDSTAESASIDGKDEAFFDVPTHQLPLTEDEEGVTKFNLTQTGPYLAEEPFRPEMIILASLPGHRTEFQRDMERKMQTHLDDNLAAEKRQWAAEKQAMAARADDAAATIESVATEKLEQDLLASFSAGEAKGHQDALVAAQPAHGWNSSMLHELLAEKDTQLQANLLDQEHAVAERVEEQAKLLAAHALEIDNLNRKLRAFSEENLKAKGPRCGLRAFGLLLMGLLMGLLLGHLLMWFFSQSPYPETQVNPVLCGGHVPCEEDDPMLDLSRGMYGV